MNRAGFWIRAFPKRFRRARGEELLATLEENEQRLTVRTVLDLVRAGWAERWRTRPPIHRWIAYRFGRKLPSEYRAWMLDDLDGWIGPRSAVSCCALPMMMQLPIDLTLLLDRSPYPVWRLWFDLVLFGSMLLLTQVFSRRLRETTLKRHGLDPLTREPFPGWFPDPRGVHEWRYWSGNAWTHYAADRGVTVEDPE